MSHCKDSFSLCLLNLWLARCFLVLNVFSHNEQGISSSMWTSLICWVIVFWDLFVFHTYCKQNHKSWLWILFLLRRVFLLDWLFWWPEQPIKSQASYRNKWLSVLLWDLGGLKGKIIAQNMGTKISLIKHIYFVIFCTGCRAATSVTFVTWWLTNG